MKTKLSLKKLVFALVCFCFSFTTSVQAQSAANVNDIMLQAFGWDVHTQVSVATEGGLYNYLKNRTNSYVTAGFNVIWLPPPSKSTGGVGYIPTELFNFSQTSFVASALIKVCLMVLSRTLLAGEKKLESADLN